MSTVFLAALFKGPAAYEPKTPWGPIWAVFATVLLFVCAAVVSLAVCELVVGLTGGQSILAMMEDAELRDDVKQQSIVWTLVMQAFLVGLTLLASMMFRANPLDVLALRAPRQGWAVMFPAFLVLFVVAGLYSGVAYVLWPQEVLKDLKPYHEMMLTGSGPLLAIAGAIGAPFSEEFLFRGFLLAALAQSPLGFLGGVLVSNTAWTALHAQYSLLGLSEVFLVGLVQSWLLWRTGSLWVPIVCHGLYNGLIILGLFLVPMVLVGA